MKYHDFEYFVGTGAIFSLTKIYRVIFNAFIPIEINYQEIGTVPFYSETQTTVYLLFQNQIF